MAYHDFQDNEKISTGEFIGTLAIAFIAVATFIYGIFWAISWVFS